MNPKCSISFTGLIYPLLLLAGCAQLSSETDIRQTTHTSLPELPAKWMVDGAIAGEIQIGWIDQIGDPLLSQFVREAQINNRNIQVAAANVEASWALVRQARSALLPTVSGSVGASRTGKFSGSIPDTSQFDYGVKAEWEVDLWGRVKAGRNAAYASAQAVEADFRYSQYSLASAVASAYFAIIETQLQIDVAERTVNALAEIDRIVRVRYREGYASSQDTAIAAADLASAIEGLENAKGAKRVAARGLEIVLGRYPGNKLDTGADLPESPSTPPAGIPSNLLERRPDIIAAERRVAAAFANLDQSKAARLPLIGLTSNLGGTSNDLGDVVNGSNLIWSIVGSVLQPIFDGGLRDAQIEQASADQKAAVSAYADTAIKAFSDVENNLDQLAVLRRRQNAFEIASQQSTRAYRLGQLRYREGETDLINVLSIQQRLFNADRNLVAIRRERMEQWVQLNLALGGDWKSESVDAPQ